MRLRSAVTAIIVGTLVSAGLLAGPAAAAGPAAPTGLTANAASNGTVHFEWSASPGASAYRVEWSADSSFVSGAVHGVDTYALDHVTLWQPAVGSPTELYWRVSAYGTGISASSLGNPSATNLVVTGSDSAPEPIGPGTSGGIEEIHYPAATVFSWEPVPGAIAYQLEYTSDTLGAGSGTVLQAVAGTQYAPANPLARVDSIGNPLTWKWRVRAQHYNGTPSSTSDVVYGAWSQPREFQITWDVAPTELYPADEITTNHSDMSFSWGAVPGAAKYRVTFGNSAEGEGDSRTILNPLERDVFTTTYIPTAQASDNTRFWQVTPLDHAGNVGKPSAVHQYKKKWGYQDGPSAPSDPGLVAPTGITGLPAGDTPPQVYLSDLEIAWEPLPRATFYMLEVRDDIGNIMTCRTASTSATIVAHYINGGDNALNGTVLRGQGACLWNSDASKRIQAGRTYNWRVSAVDLSGSSTVNYQTGNLPVGVQQSGWSQTRYFAVKAEDREFPLLDKVDLDLDAFVVDNPANQVGQPAPLMTWNAFGPDVPGYEVTLYKNDARTAEIGTFRTPSTRLRLNGVLADNTTGNPYYASVRPIIPNPSWTSASILVIGGIDSESEELFVWQKASKALSGLATQTLSDGSVRLSWNPQSVTGLLDGGSRGYQIRIFNGDALQGVSKKVEYPFFMAQRPATSDDNEFPSTMTDQPLAPGNNYTFEIAPLDANGNPGRLTRSPVFSVGVATPAVSAPATVNGGSVAISWSTVPGALKYSVQYRRENAPTWTTLSNIAQTAATLNGLEKGNYEWQVRTHDASNQAANVSAWSTARPFAVGSGAVTLDTPDAQVLLLKDRVLRWTSTVNGAARYQVQIADDPNFTQGIKNYETVATSFAISHELVASRQYHWRVRALAEPVGSNAVIRVLATSTGRTFTVRTTPAKLARPKLAVAGTGLTASWPLLTGEKTGTDQPITYVVAYREKTSDGDWSGATTKTTSQSASSYTVSGLARGKVYQFRVAGKNSEGLGPWSDVAELATATVPKGAPTLAVTPKLGELALKIGKVSANGGSPITGYRLSFRKSSASAWTTRVIPVSASYTLTGLSKATSYDVSVAAINAVGNGAATVVSSKTLGVPSTPRSVKATRGDKQATVAWTAPAQTNGTVTGYVLQYRLGTSGAWKSAGTATASAKKAVVTRLVNGKAYQVRVAARTKVGLGTYSAPVKVTPAGKPIKPTKVTAKSDAKGKITVTWNKAAANGSKITSYTVKYSTDGKSWKTLKKVGASTVKLTTTKGTRGKKVYFQVIATNALGNAAPTKTVNVVRK